MAGAATRYKSFARMPLIVHRNAVRSWEFQLIICAAISVRLKSSDVTRNDRRYSNILGTVVRGHGRHFSEESLHRVWCELAKEFSSSVLFAKTATALFTN